METKASIRTKYKTLRNAMPENIVREESQRICQNISTWEIFQKAQNCFSCSSSAKSIAGISSFGSIT